jgi:Ala-tRNA(Pro) deacylase
VLSAAGGASITASHSVRRWILPIAKLKEFLDNCGVKYVTTVHSPSYTARELATMTRTPGRQVAKTIIVKIDSEFAMLVLPACLHVDFEVLGVELNARRVRLALEVELKSKFPDCEIGAMPPFGNLYGMPVYVDESLTKAPEIAFAAGSHREMIRLSYADFERLVQPKVFAFSAVTLASA